ncbi:ABC transporter substrate-binding protein [Actinomadura macra]|uniref:ABC transporter substrate-binding protein n=1 Tax=Actinomadura macra TaxID=46164 RepID=UPI000829E86C|nr:ABC transporter substrate-binding protein [Actinomadura macra]
MRKLSAVAMTLCLTASMLAGCGAQNEGNNGARAGDCGIKFGGVVEQTGSLQVYGAPATLAMNLLTEDVKAEGGVKVGGRSCSFDTSLVDYRSDPAAVLSSAQQIAEKGVIAALGPAINGAVARKVWTEGPNKIVTIVTDGETAADIAAGEKFPLSFLPFPPGAVSYAASVRRMVAANPGIKRVTIIAPDNDNDNGKVFEQVSAKLGLEVSKVVFPAKTTDFSAFLVQVQKTRPDLLIGLNNTEQVKSIFRQALQMGVARYYLAEHITADDAARLQKGTDAVIGVATNAPSSSTIAPIPAYDAKALFGDKQPGFLQDVTVEIYYMGRVLLAAISKAGTVDDAKRIADAVEGQSWKGPFGTCTVKEAILTCETNLFTVGRDGITAYRFPDAESNEPLAVYGCKNGSCTEK